MTRAEDSGWADGAAGTPWHWFEGLRSLCGRVSLECRPAGGFSPDRPNRYRVCRACLRKRVQLVFFEQERR
jgi:hypothetical protein